MKLNVTDALHLLEAVGVVRLESSAHHDNLLTVHPIPSLLNLPRSSFVPDDVRDDFLRDLTLLLVRLHRSGVDFYRPGRDGEEKRLVPESVFAAHLALGFELLGWRSEREAQRGAGRTDLLLRRNGDPEVVVLVCQSSNSLPSDDGRGALQLHHPNVVMEVETLQFHHPGVVMEVERCNSIIPAS